MIRVQLIVELSGKLVANCAQRIPPAFSSCRNAVTRSVVPVDTTIRAQAFAILAAHNIAGNCEQPRLSYSRSHVETVGHWIERVYIGIVLGIFSLGRIDEVSFLIDRHAYLPEAAAARNLGITFYLSTEIKPVRAGRRQTAMNLDRLYGAHIAFLPDRITRCELAIDMRCLRLQ
jgi:hypothetical protein